MESDPLYEQARQILAANPTIGKLKLGQMLGIKTPSSRRRIERYRGETQGHSQQPDYVRVRQLKDQHPDWGAARLAQALGLSIDHAKLHLARWLGAQSYPGANAIPSAGSPAVTSEPSPSRDNELQDTVQDGKRDLDYRGTRIQTVDDLLVYAQVDSRVWEVKEHSIKKSEVAAKPPEGMATTMRFQIKAKLIRKVAERKLQALMQGLMAQFQLAAPIRPVIVQREGARGLLEISLMDHHFGKYCSAQETGRAYDADIAERMFITALEDLLRKSSSLPVEKILFVCGNDFLNTDHLGRATTAGTPQDESIRYQESFSRGRDLLVRAIDRLREIAPVHVVMVTGNHDTQRLYYLGDVLQAWFRNTKAVVVDNGSQQRKYFQYHQNLIGFTHGDNEKHSDLPLLLATDQPAGWAATRHREFHLGHFHGHKHKMFVVPSYDWAGVLVRILPSLCPPDAWHAAMGYRARLAAEALYFDPEEGCVANFIHSPN